MREGPQAALVETSRADDSGAKIRQGVMTLSIVLHDPVYGRVQDGNDIDGIERPADVLSTVDSGTQVGETSPIS
jgi:hypothetical protein